MARQRFAAAGLAAAAATGFTAVSSWVATGAHAGWDEAMLQSVAARHTPALDACMVLLSQLGDPRVLFVAALACALVRRRDGVAGWLPLILLAPSVAANLFLKDWYGRPRPVYPEPLEIALLPGFPSGHAMLSACIYGTIAYLLGRRHALAVRGGCLLLVLGIGFSRVYLGAHYPLDVVGGWLAGLALLAFGVALAPEPPQGP